MNGMTQREQRVLEQRGRGNKGVGMAEALARSPHTIHDHVKSLHRKLNVSSRGELIARVLGHIGASDVSNAPAAEQRSPPLARSA